MAATPDRPVAVCGPDGSAHMRRRDFIAVIGGAVVCPFIAHAEERRKAYRILWVSAETQPDPFLDGFREGDARAGLCRGQKRCLRDSLCTGQSSRAAPGHCRIEARRHRPRRVQRARDARHGRCHGMPVLFALSGDPVRWAWSRAWPSPAPISPAARSSRSNSRESALNCSRTFIQSFASSRCSRTRTIRASRRNGAPPSRRATSSASSRSTLLFMARPN